MSRCLMDGQLSLHQTLSLLAKGAITETRLNREVERLVEVSTWVSCQGAVASALGRWGRERLCG